MAISMLMFFALFTSGSALPRKNAPIVFNNGSVRLAIDRKAGLYELDFASGPRIAAIDSVVRLSNGPELRASALRTHSVTAADIVPVRDKLGSGTRLTVHHRSPDLPELRQVFWIYRGRNEAIVEVEVGSSHSVGSNHMAAFVTSRRPVWRKARALRSLFVPYDNDDYARYRTDCWVRAASDQGSNEVGSIFDDRSRKGLVLGSIDHDIWKSEVRFSRSASGGVDGIEALAGARAPKHQLNLPHAMVSGNVLPSPRFVIGWYSDWRTGLERYGALNALVQPALAWTGGVPVGWNSWAGHKNKLRAEDAKAATDFIAAALRGLRNEGTAYINLDSYWDNLTKAQLAEFTRHAHERGLRAGIYWTPFVAWGDLAAPVAGDPLHTYRDLALKDAQGSPMPKFSGGVPLDPTNPATLERIDRELADFVAEGFDFVKLDFLSHGAVEGRHYDKTIQTGTAAYRVGMRRIVADLSPASVGRPFFISLSIAPLFPQGYGHSRRISCDAFADIGSTEYLLNSASYGWWTNRTLYRFDDPDSACVYQAFGEPPTSESEGRTRLTASVIAGGMLFEGDNLTLPAARERVRALFSTDRVVALARLALAFRPFESAARDRSTSVFYAVDRYTGETFLAAFNYSHDRHKQVVVPLSRLGRSSSRVHVYNLWTGQVANVKGTLRVDLAPKDCVLLRLK